MGQCMGLPVGAANSSIPTPSPRPKNAARSSARATQNSSDSSVQIVTRSYMNDRDLLRTDGAVYNLTEDWSESGSIASPLPLSPDMKFLDKSELAEACNHVIDDGNPEDRALKDLKLILLQCLADALIHGLNSFTFSGDYGQVIVELVDGNGVFNINTYTPISNNRLEFRKEIHLGITNEFSLLVMRAMHEKSIVDNFLSELAG